MIYQSISIKPKLEQNLKLTPDAIQHLKILQLNQVELIDYINRELESNPMLERDESSQLSHEELSAYFNHLGKDRGHQLKAEEDMPETSFTYVPTLSEHLLSEAGLLQLDSSVFKALRILIGSLDERGYLSCSLEEVSEKFSIPLSTTEEAFKALRMLEPKGVGALDLADCLLLQIESEDSEYDLMSVLIKDCLELVAENKLKQICSKLKVSMDCLSLLLEKLKSLDPKPGIQFSTLSYDETEYIVPDLTLEIEGGELKVKTVDDLYPKLMINEEYRKLLSADTDKESRDFITEKLNSAIFVLKSIEQRKHTLISVAETIVDFQKDFFLEKRDISPLNMRDIAEKVGVHESTVSRAIRGKYLASPVGIYSLRYFFSNKAVASSDSSSLQIKKKLKELLESENSAKPYSDQKLSEMLLESGLKVARRTVAKYREELGFKSSSLRKVHKK